MSQSPSLRGSGRFLRRDGATVPNTLCLNPLHCGAVVASRRRWIPGCPRAARSQSPSLRGSGRFAARPSPPDAVASSQSPSLRGSGRFTKDGRARRAALRVSIPFIAGQWSLHGDAPDADGDAPNVSIPFIAGQWSLPARERRMVRRRGRFNPLHCGAVVASYGRGEGPRGRLPEFQSPSLRGSGRFTHLPPLT